MSDTLRRLVGDAKNEFSISIFTPRDQTWWKLLVSPHRRATRNAQQDSLFSFSIDVREYGVVELYFGNCLPLLARVEFYKQLHSFIRSSYIRVTLTCDALTILTFRNELPFFVETTYNIQDQCGNNQRTLHVIAHLQLEAHTQQVVQKCFILKFILFEIKSGTDLTTETSQSSQNLLVTSISTHLPFF